MKPRSTHTETLPDEIRGRTAEEAIARLDELGLLDWRACEARAIRAALDRLVRQGVTRCGAFEIAARAFHCSYGKVRDIHYNHKKH